MIHSSTMAAMMALALLSVETVRAGQAEAGPTVAVIALQGWGNGDWAMRIQANHIAGVTVAGSTAPKPAPRALSKSERERLALLVGRLPRDRARYSFGKTAIDVTTDFELAVGVGAEERKYSVGEILEEAEYGPDLRAILDTLHFLHSLAGSKQALLPPPVHWRARKQ